LKESWEGTKMAESKAIRLPVVKYRRGKERRQDLASLYEPRWAFEVEGCGADTVVVPGTKRSTEERRETSFTSQHRLFPVEPGKFLQEALG
jgi:hypothetical protein